MYENSKLELVSVLTSCLMVRVFSCPHRASLLSDKMDARVNLELVGDHILAYP